MNLILRVFKKTTGDDKINCFIEQMVWLKGKVKITESNKSTEKKSNTK